MEIWILEKKKIFQAVADTSIWTQIYTERWTQFESWILQMIAHWFTRNAHKIGVRKLKFNLLIY